MSAVLQIDNVRKTYPRAWLKPPVEAVCGISLEIARGEAFGFIGPNGAGKSTAIKMITGVLHATSGRVLINGLDVADHRARTGLGFVPENPYLNDYLTPLEVLLMGVRIHELQLADEKAHCMKWLERFDLAAAANRRIRTFSKGMTQRTALAHALAIKPSFLVLDEPLSGLDPVGRREVVDILEEYRQQGGTIFFSSHVLHDVERLADRFGVINRGQIVSIRSPRELAEERADEFVIRFHSSHRFPDAVSLRGDEFELPARASELPSRLAEIQNAGARLIEVHPAVSLESMFLKLVKS